MYDSVAVDVPLARLDLPFSIRRRRDVKGWSVAVQEHAMLKTAFNQGSH